MPSNKKEVESFIGLVNYFGRLIPQFSNKILPINNLRKKETQFIWSNECQESFDKLKTELSSHPIVRSYCLKKEATLTTDASKEAIGAVLTQEGHPVIFVSRTLSEAEKNYSNIEREALAIVWSVSRLSHFLLGRKFTLQTDHRPLIYLLGNNQAIPDHTSLRITKWALNLMQYDYIITHVPGKEITHADAMTRLRFSNQAVDFKTLSNARMHSVVFQTILNPQEVQSELQLDTRIQGIMNRVKLGKWSKCSQYESSFKAVSVFLTIENGMLYKGSRLFIPERLRRKAIDSFHKESHSGIQSSCRMIQNAAWWPGMTRDIEQYVNKCEICSTLRPQKQKTVHEWPNATPFERLHIDWAYSRDVGNILIIVDSGSGWIEAFRTKERTTENVIKCLRTVFTRFGIPECIVSDNAPEFISKEFLAWIENQGARKIESPPYFPMANGRAERAVQTIKKGIKCWKLSQCHMEFDVFLQKMLFYHRISANYYGKSPAEMVFGRQIRRPIVSTFDQGQSVGYKPSSNHELTNHQYLMPKGRNTSWIMDVEGEEPVLRLSSNNQIYSPGTKKATEKTFTSQENTVDNSCQPTHLTETMPDGDNRVRSQRSRRPPNLYGEWTLERDM